jgi:hypothetical protein
MLVGGTALAGFYAGHRRSDDLDLFTATAEAQWAVRLAVKSLAEIGGVVDNERNSAQYFHADCELDAHAFTVDVVHDARLFEVGTGLVVDGLTVASLDTLLMTKAATLVSRCSEKDLYDLIWILDHVEGLELPDLIDRGQRIDGGLSAESVLMVATGTKLSERSCGFCLAGGRSAAEVFSAVSAFKERLQETLSKHLHGQQIPPLGRLVRTLRGDW